MRAGAGAERRVGGEDAVLCGRPVGTSAFPADADPAAALADFEAAMAEPRPLPLTT